MLHIGGLQKTSLIDFPGRVSCVLFLAGCNYHCPYCHNPQIVKKPAGSPSNRKLEEFYSFLKQRAGFLDGLVITGGEPTLQPGLVELCKTVKQIGYAVKLDTNGSRPDVLQSLLDGSLVDYVAMDIKAAPDQYAPLFSPNRDPGPVLESIAILRNRRVAHEFRTTCLKPVISPPVIDAIARLIEGAPLYALQTCHTDSVLDPSYFRKFPESFDHREMKVLQTTAQKWVQTVVVR